MCDDSLQGHRFKLRYDGMINVLEIPKVREYDSGSIRVVAKNRLGEAECSTTLVVVPHEDWRARLKQAPRCESTHNTFLVVQGSCTCWCIWCVVRGENVLISK